MGFCDYIETVDWDALRHSISMKTSRDVERALEKERCTLADFDALISPAAAPYLEQMAQKAQSLTRARFGHTIGFYVPLYLSNLCSNDCTYCGFSMKNKLKRKTLTSLEIDLECQAIRSMGFDSILLVTGEHQTKVGMNYFRHVIPQIKQQFNYVSMEVQPLNEEDYEELVELGLDAVMVYQETYNQETYARHHLKGNKTNFAYRLDTPDRLGRAGVDKIGLGALIGLDDWPTDIALLARHLQYLEQTYWKTRYSISFPRLRPCAGGVDLKSVMNDRQLLQVICAFRIFNHEVELSLSTRESASFRDHVVPIAITSVSAASKTQPGGYANTSPELEQFSTGDERSVGAVANAMVRKGLQPVWKDWERGYSKRAMS